MIDILNRENVFERLSQLSPEDPPQFGVMTPQHMVEHLAFVVGFSNGKEPQQHAYPSEKEEKIKAFVIDADNDMPIGFKSPVLPQKELPALKHIDLSDAIDNLKNELEDFDRYFHKHPSAKPVNPTMGELNHKEWIIFHNKHVAHHFRQFNLLEE